MNYTLLVSMVLFVALCNASSTSDSEQNEVELTLMRGMSSHKIPISASDIDRYSGKPLLELMRDVPCVLASLEHVTGFSTEVRLWAGRTCYMQQTQNGQDDSTMDPWYYLVTKKPNNKFLGLYLGAQKDAADLTSIEAKRLHALLACEPQTAQIEAVSFLTPSGEYEAAAHIYDSALASADLARDTHMKLLTMIAGKYFENNRDDEGKNYALQAAEIYIGPFLGGVRIIAISAIKRMDKLLE